MLRASVILQSEMAAAGNVAVFTIIRQGSVTLSECPRPPWVALRRLNLSKPYNIGSANESQDPRRTFTVSHHEFPEPLTTTSSNAIRLTFRVVTRWGALCGDIQLTPEWLEGLIFALVASHGFGITSMRS